MPNPNAIVSTTVRIEPPIDRPFVEMLQSERGLSVELEGGRHVRLDPVNPLSAGYAQILDGLGKYHLPVYLEIDPGTTTITWLLIPLVTRVLKIRPIDEGKLGIELDRSQVRHVLRLDSSDFTELERQLRESLSKGTTILLTENDAHEIIHIRDYPGQRVPPVPLDKPGGPLRLAGIWRQLFPPGGWPRLPWWYNTVTQTQAANVFKVMSATSCNPCTVPPPCIPFLYPDSGCWARANEMCRLMIKMGFNPNKVWISGNLMVQTKNNPNCHVNWSWHVAPTLKVRGSGMQTETVVIDPSLFNRLVTEATWMSILGDPNAMLTETDASIYILYPTSSTDPDYSQTDQDLAQFRLTLQTRSLHHGPPPYANCM